MWIDDQILKQCQLEQALKVWVPDSPMVVLGSSNKAPLEVNLPACQAANIPVLKRYGGGGTVLLYPGCVIVSLGVWVKRLFDNDFYFKHLNQAMLTAVQNMTPATLELNQNGLSDLCLGAKKFGGTSLFRSKNYLLYQASILVDCDFDLIDTYLKHPSKEPDYRQARSHRDFLVGLSENRPDFSVESVFDALQKNLQTTVRAQLSAELIEPQANQIKNIEARIRRAEASS